MKQRCILIGKSVSVECGTCNPKVVGSSFALSKVPSFACSKNYGPRQGRVRQLALRASLESVGGSYHERVAWSLYKCEDPPVCVPRATGDKGVKRISPHTLGTRDHATTCHKQEEGAFPPVSWAVSHFITRIRRWMLQLPTWGGPMEGR